MPRNSKGQFLRGQFKHELTGQKFGQWEVLERAEPGCRNFTMWLCRCECGLTKPVYQHQLLAGRTTGCGCRNSRQLSERARTHGLSKTSEYKCWIAMKVRCQNPKANAYHHYGGRGIKVCERWESFDNFLADMGPRPSLDHSVERKDVDGGYSPDNCCWATQAEQNRNRRNNRTATCDGVTKTLKEWSEITGIPFETLTARWRYGWSGEDIVKRPVCPKTERKRDDSGKFVHEQRETGSPGDG